MKIGLGSPLMGINTNWTIIFQFLSYEQQALGTDM